MRLVIVLLTLVLGLAGNAQPLSLHPLHPDVLLYQTYHGGYNAWGLALRTSEGIVMLDTPWDSTQAPALLDSLQARWQQPVVFALATHFHEDRTGSFGPFNARSIPTFTTALTYEWCLTHKQPLPRYTLDGDTLLRFGRYQVEVYYPGMGHSPDNVVVYIPELDLLYGGCFIKGMGSKNLGNLGDAHPEAWLVSLQKVMHRYPHAQVVIPGHDQLDGAKPLAHTLELLRTYLAK